MKHELSDIDPQKMDSQKWDMLLDLLEHPEKYSETQKDELLGDEEVNELYQQLVETRQSLDFAKSKEKMKMPSIDAEWEKLKDEMMRQKNEYRRLNQQAHTALDAIGAQAKGQSAAARMSVSMGIRTRTMLDKSTRNLATMLAEGSGQGVLDCKRAETDYPQASPGAHKLMEELCAFQTGAEQAWREFV